METIPEKRGDIRIPVIGSSVYVYFLTERKLEEVITSVFDISSKGIGVLSFEKFKQDENVLIYGDSLGVNPKSATIKWCLEMTVDFYRIGIVFDIPELY